LLRVCSYVLSLNIHKSYIIKYWIKWQHGLWTNSQYKTNVKNLREMINSETDKMAYITCWESLLELKNAFISSLCVILNLPLKLSH